MPATFSDLQGIATQIVNDNTAQNNAVAAQVAEVRQLLSDYAAALASGQGGPSADDLTSLVQQLQAVDQSITANTKAITDSGASITEADPHAAPPSQTSPTPATV